MNAETRNEIGRCANSPGGNGHCTNANDPRNTGMQASQHAPASAAPIHGRFTARCRALSQAPSSSTTPRSRASTAGFSASTHRTQHTTATG